MQAMQRIANEHGDRVAMVCEDTRQTYRQLHDRAQRLVHGLRDHGIVKGDRVALLVDNGPQTLEQIVALGYGGFVRTGLYAHDSPERHQYLLELTGASALIVNDRYFEALEPILANCAALHCVIVIGQSATALEAVAAGRALDYEMMLAQASRDSVDITSSLNDPHQIRFSAGTTGLPKGILHDLAGWIAVGDNTVAMLDEPLTADDCYLAAGPLTHAAIMLVWPILSAGGTIVVLPSFDVERFLAAVETERVTMTLVVPTMVQMITDNADAANRDLSSLRVVFYGASPMPEPVLAKALKLWGNILYQLYGQSEASPVTVLPAADHRIDGSSAEQLRLQSVGRPIGSARVRILDNHDAELPAGKVGEVIVSAEGRMREIWGDPSATAERLTDDGWVRTRDMGWLDDEGFLFLSDRKEDMIISGGFNIWPAELENALAAHPAVHEAAVVGVPHPRWGESPHAAVVLNHGQPKQVSEQELIEWTRERLGSVKKLTGVHFVSELPRTPIGKVLRREVRDQLRP